MNRRMYKHSRCLDNRRGGESPFEVIRRIVKECDPKMIVSSMISKLFWAEDEIRKGRTKEDVIIELKVGRDRLKDPDSIKVMDMTIKKLEES